MEKRLFFHRDIINVFLPIYKYKLEKHGRYIDYNTELSVCIANLGLEGIGV